MQIENYGIQIKIIQCKKSFRIQIENQEKKARKVDGWDIVNCTPVSFRHAHGTLGQPFAGKQLWKV